MGYDWDSLIFKVCEGGEGWDRKKGKEREVSRGIVSEAKRNIVLKEGDRMRERDTERQRETDRQTDRDRDRDRERRMGEESEKKDG